MSRHHDTDRYELSDAEKRDLIELIQRGKILPDKYRFLLFENEWQSFRTRKDRDLELISAAHNYAKPGRYTIAVKVIDIFGNDTMTLVPVTVG